MQKNKNNGFTLIELLVVISIIGMLASIVLLALNSARTKARDTKRRADLKQLSTALELYYNDNNSYPVTNAWRGYCQSYSQCTSGVNNSCTTSGATGYIPNLAPTYLSQLPRDPKENLANNYCYLYNSNGTDYMLMAYNTVENCSTISTDPMRRQGFPTECDYTIYSPGAINW